MYSRSAIASHFEVNIETIRRWSKDFASYLSHTANSPTKSLYTDSDMEVLTFVQACYKANDTTESIAASLASGSRGVWDGVLKQQSVTISEERSHEIDSLVTDLRNQLNAAQQEIAVLKSQVADKDALVEEIKQLNREIGRLEARIEILKEG